MKGYLPQKWLHTLLFHQFRTDIIGRNGSHLNVERNRKKIALDLREFEQVVKERTRELKRRERRSGRRDKFFIANFPNIGNRTSLL